MAVCKVCSAKAVSKCSRCVSAHYCGVVCQRKDYPEHRKECQERLYIVSETRTGKGLVARCQIPPATVILKDAPILVLERGKGYHDTYPGVQETLSLVPATPGEKSGDHLARAVLYTGHMIRTDAYAVYPTARFVNHSCAPNAVMSRAGATVQVTITTIKDISPGEEITMSYTPTNYSGKESRSKDLPFECMCEICTDTNESLENYREKFEVILGVILEGKVLSPETEAKYMENCLKTAKLIAGGPGIDFLTFTVLALYSKRWFARSEESSSFRRDIQSSLIYALQSLVRVSEVQGNTSGIIHKKYTRMLDKVLKYTEPLPAA